MMTNADIEAFMTELRFALSEATGLGHDDPAIQRIALAIDGLIQVHLAAVTQSTRRSAG